MLLYFTTYTGFGLCERDFVIEGKPVSPLALYEAVFLRNGFESVRLENNSPSIAITNTCVLGMHVRRVAHHRRYSGLPSTFRCGSLSVRPVRA